MRTIAALVLSVLVGVFFAAGCAQKPSREIRVITPNYSYQNASNHLVKDKNL